MRGSVARGVLCGAVLALLCGGAAQDARFILPANPPNTSPMNGTFPGTGREEERPSGLFGCLHLHGVPLVAVTVVLRQEGQDTQTTVTNADGCYQFNEVLSDTTFEMIVGPIMP